MAPQLPVKLLFAVAATVVGGLAAVMPNFALLLVALLAIVLITVMVRRKITPALGLSVCAFVAVFGEQLTLTVGEPARNLPIGTLVLTYTAVLLAWQWGRGRLTGYLLSSGLPIVAWVAMGVALISAGVVSGFPAHTLAAWLPLFGLLGALVIGKIAVLAGTDIAAVLHRSMVPLLWISAAVGLIQFLHHAGIPLPGSHELVAYIQSRAEELGRTLTFARATGVYTNPNTFALLGGIGLLIALAGRQSTVANRAMTAIPAIAIIAMSQSRATIVAAILALVVHFIREQFLSRSPGPSSIRAVLVLVFSLILVWAAVAQLAPEVLDSLITRVSQLFETRGVGASADPSVIGRLEYWEAGLTYFADRPLGTLGPPQMVIAAGIDNEYLFALLQGGVVYLALLVWVMVAAVIAAVRVGSPLSLALPLYVMLVGVSQVVTLTIPAVLFWAVLGAGLAHSRNTASSSSTSLHESSLPHRRFGYGQGRKS